MPNIKKLSSLALLSLFSLPLTVNAASFEFENFKLEWDTVFTAGIQYRIEKPNRKTSRGSNGLDGSMDSLPGLLDNAYIINSNDGNNNFSKGITSERISILTEADFNFGDWGVFARAKTWRDFRYSQKLKMSDKAWAENNNNPVFGGFSQNDGFKNEIPPEARHYAESGIKLLDLFWYGKINVFEKDISLRIGRQVISWGEAMLSGGGINMATSAVDAHIRNQPGLEIKELFLPTNAILLQTDITDSINLQFFYQIEFTPAFIDPSGTFMSEFDSIGHGGNKFMFVSGTEEQILGKDLKYNDRYNVYSNGVQKGHVSQWISEYGKSAWENHAALNGFDAEYARNLDNLLVFLPTTCNQESGRIATQRCNGLIPHKVRVDKAKDRGQFGLSLKFFLDSGDELGLYYVNYHEKIPNYILPIDAIEDMAAIIDLLVYVADPACYNGVASDLADCGGARGGKDTSLLERGGFKGIEDLDYRLSMKQINALLLFLSALPEDQGTIGQITYDMVRDSRKIFGDNDTLLTAFTDYIGSNPLLSAIATAGSITAANAVLSQFGFNANTIVRSINYRLQYAEDVHLIGTTYSTIVGTANVATEITYRANTPLMGADIPRTPRRFQLINWHVNMLQVFEPVHIGNFKLWDFSTLVAEAITWYVPGALAYDTSNRDNLNKKRLAVQNSPTGFGLSAFWSLEYHNVMPGWDIMWIHYMNWGVDGSMFNSGYRDGQVAYATAVSFKHLTGIEIGLGVTTFFGDTDDVFQMLTQDRDNMSLHFKYGF